MLHRREETAAGKPVEAGQTPQIVVKFMAKGHAFAHREIFLRQFPHRSGEWGRCRFVFDPEETTYDWIAAYDDLAPTGTERFSNRVESLRCPPSHTLFVTMEPSSIKTYGYDFLDQFGVIVTSQEPWAITNQQAVYTQPALRWFYGEGKDHIRTYDEMTQSPPVDKTANISAVCSDKQQTNTVHAQRYAFTMRLKELLPELELYGRGIRPIDDKADALDAFRYHIAIENHICEHHWTEKLSDAFLGLTLPFYYGCPNATDYFPAESFIPIDVANPNAAASRIRRAIEINEYERRLPFIIEARRRVLEDYNLFAVISREIEQRHDASAAGEPSAQLYSRHRMRSRSLLHGLRFAIEQARRKRTHRRLSRRKVA